MIYDHCIDLPLRTRSAGRSRSSHELLRSSSAIATPAVPRRCFWLNDTRSYRPPIPPAYPPSSSLTPHSPPSPSPWPSTTAADTPCPRKAHESSPPHPLRRLPLSRTAAIEPLACDSASIAIHTTCDSTSIPAMPTSRLRRAARVILIGAPGVGKGTQTERLMKRFPQLSAISSGDLLRDNVRNKTPLGESPFNSFHDVSQTLTSRDQAFKPNRS